MYAINSSPKSQIFNPHTPTSWRSSLVTRWRSLGTTYRTRAPLYKLHNKRPSLLQRTGKYIVRNNPGLARI
ncbi:hypothetical protein Y1Q_0021327 [Alligator mississippiensis]|uniref:Uncharacterized protein n=1 Tax=Alligator mississippiensis TaxID=8496 RepID=A0A151P971_ALLMI|nr:hypothetical protein Y1Q_0021327 [Alligator mississippiensis]